MTVYTRRRVDTEDEKRMVIGLITSDRICREVLPLVDLDYLQIDYSRVVVPWVKGYYERYGKAPGRHIQDLYEAEKGSLRSERQTLVSGFLEALSQDYERLEEVNEAYIVDKSIQYLDERSLLNLSEMIKANVVAGKKEEAKALLNNHRKVVSLVSDWANPLALAEVNVAMDRERDVLFRMPGAIGRLIGPFHRGDLFGVMAPVKRGKTWFLMELGVMGLVHRLKVAFISLEMRKEKMEKRLYRRLASLSVEGGDVLYPFFDCLSNQDGSCGRPERKGSGDLLDEDGNVRPFDEKLDWVPCDACRGKREGGFLASDVHWYVRVKRPKFDLSTVRASMRSLWTTFGYDNMRLKCYPRFSANVKDVLRDLDVLEYAEGFLPDIIIVDYADILRPENRLDSGRDMVNETWMTLAQMAGYRKALVVTATQSSRESWDAKNTRARHVSEDYRKIANVDGMGALSQTPEEKRRNIMRFSIVAARDEEFSELNQVRVLQQLDAGQSLLDSEFESEFFRREERGE